MTYRDNPFSASNMAWTSAEVVAQGALLYPDARTLYYLRHTDNAMDIQKYGRQVSLLNQIKNNPDPTGGLLKGPLLDAQTKKSDAVLKELKRKGSKMTANRMPRGIASPADEIEHAVQKTGLEWNPAKLRWYKNGKMVSSKTAGRMLGKVGSAAKVFGKFAMLEGAMMAGMSYLEERGKGASIETATTKGLAHGAAGVAIYAVARDAALETFASLGGPADPAAWVGAILVGGAIAVGGESAATAIIDAPQKYARVAKSARESNFINHESLVRDRNAVTIRQRSVALAAKHGLNARFQMGSEAALYHK